MNQLQRFYQWVHTTPSLFELNAPFCSLDGVASLPYTHAVYQGNPRLGFIYQHLVSYHLNTSNQYSIALEELQLNRDNGQTLGAIDFIVQDRVTQQYQHWEVAIKFYLLHQGIWYGPNAHDQLDKKLDRMLHHQLKMSSSDPFLKSHPDYHQAEEKLLMQGRLYINPFSDEATPDECLGFPLNKTQINGYWCYQSQWHQIEEPLYELEKPQWATGLDVFDSPIEELNGRFTHAQTKSGQFWFIVVDTWPC
ncbi:DUF1853 family protein [Vibrio maerlii]|uniref:DUF1853 family protein n=1 Tax=Vibrio maerlii TaxID=2231648 RepID=UPI000E3BB73E|nr:DUF1853 family protein [Vibrio maerlii]